MNIDISTWLNLFFGIMYRNWSGADADKKDFIKLLASDLTTSLPDVETNFIKLDDEIQKLRDKYQSTHYETMKYCLNVLTAWNYYRYADKTGSENYPVAQFNILVTQTKTILKNYRYFDLCTSFNVTR